MSLTAVEVRNDLLNYVGLEDASQASEAIRRRIFNDMNAALQEVYTRGPAFLREKSFAAGLNAPRDVDGKTFTQFTTEMSGGDVISDNMRGCTFRIDGEAVDNEIVDAGTLQIPFQGATTTSGSGTVFSDCLIFPEDVAAISGPVWLDSQYQLQALSGRMELLNQVTVYQRTEIGAPRFYWVETYGGQLRLRVYPMPDRTYILRYDAQLKAPQLDFATLWPEVEESASANLIIDQVLTGLNTTATGSVSATDSILQAFGKLGNRIGALWGRNISAGTGLTGGGDLSADRTIAVNFGASAGTVCAGDDSRLMTGEDKAKLDGISSAALSVMQQTTNQAMQMQMGLRKVLTAAKTYYVRTDGSDANDGSANDAGHAFLTIQAALNVVGKLDIGIYDVHVQVGDGTYTGGATYYAPMTSGGSVYLDGNASTPASVIISPTFASSMNGAIMSYNQVGAILRVNHIKLQTTTHGYGIFAQGCGSNVVIHDVSFDVCADGHMKIVDGAQIIVDTNYFMTGSAPTHIEAWSGMFDGNGCTITCSDGLTFTPTSQYGVIWAERPWSNISYENCTFIGTKKSGACTNGVKYRIGDVSGGADFTNAGAPANYAGCVFTGNGNTPASYGTGNLFVNPTGRKYFIVNNAMLTASNYTAGYTAEGKGGMIGDSEGIVRAGGVYINNTTLTVRQGDTRTRLYQGNTYYVRTDGNDNNTGLINDSNGAFLTIQAAINKVAGLDLNGFTVTIRVGAGTYTSGITHPGFTGNGSVYVVGDTTTPSNVIIDTSAGATTDYPVSAAYVSGIPLIVKGMRLKKTNGYLMNCRGAGTVIMFDKLEFDAAGNYQVYLADRGQIIMNATASTLSYAITGACASDHVYNAGGTFNVASATIKVADSLSFGESFSYTSRAGYTDFTNCVFVGTKTSGACTNGVVYRIGANTGGADFTNAGAANNNVGTEFTGNGNVPTSYGTGNLFAMPTSGPRYKLTLNGVLYLSGVVLPGASAGTTATGGQTQ